MFSRSIPLKECSKETLSIFWKNQKFLLSEFIKGELHHVQ